MNINIPSSQMAIQQYLAARDNGKSDMRLMIDGNKLVCRSYSDISLFIRITAKLFGRGVASFKNVMNFASQCSLDTKTINRLNNEVTSYNREHVAFKRALGLSLPIPKLEKLEASPRGRTIVEVNREVLERQCSDHSIITFYTSDGPIISSNVMCCGEDHNRNDANSFRIDPAGIEACEKEARLERLKNMVAILKKTALQASEKKGKLPIIALQEFPRVNATGYEDFRKLIADNFPEYTVCFGKVESYHHRSSQLCMLIPKTLEKEEIPHYSKREPRIQVIVVGEIAFINIHPSTNPNEDKSKDSLQDYLQQICGDLFKTHKELKNIHIVGDWNRKKKELTMRWKHVDSADQKSHYPKHISMLKKNDGTEVWPGPIDHHVFVTRES